MADSTKNTADLRSRFELKTLLDTSRLLIESYDPDFILNNLLLITMGKLFTTKGAILLRENDDYFKVAKSKGLKGIKEDQLIECIADTCKTDKPISNLDDFGDNLPPVFEANGINTFFNIKTSSRHLGFLCIGAKVNKNPYTPDELNFIENLVIISAVAISNSLLISDLKETNRELDKKIQELNTLFDISKELNATVDRAQMLNIFRFALLGQMLIRKFFFIMMMDGKPIVATKHGVTDEPTDEQMEELLKLDRDFIFCSDLPVEVPFLVDNEIAALVRLKFQNETAILGVGKRANKKPFSSSDFAYLVSLGSLAFLSLQKSFLLESRIEQERMQEELNIARTIQTTLFPNPLPKATGYDIAALNVPSREVGGDYYDVLKPNENQLYLAIADVTGKGVPASLLMANLQAILHILAPLNMDIAESTAKVNDIIFNNTPSDKFISFFWGWLDLDTDEFHYCNAGHNPPVLANSKSKKVELLSDGGMLLGALPTLTPYTAGRVKLEIGEVVVMFTDGISEAMDADENEYGEERLADCVAKHVEKSASEILDALVKEVTTFCNGNYGDDLTLLVIKKTA